MWILFNLCNEPLPGKSWLIQPLQFIGLGRVFSSDARQSINWSAHSAEQKPNQRLWDIIYCYIQHHHHVAPQTFQELTDVVIQVWGHPGAA